MKRIRRDVSRIAGDERDRDKRPVRIKLGTIHMSHQSILEDINRMSQREQAKQALGSAHTSGE